MSASPVVLITGASRGIGAATALRLDQQGFRVYAGIRHPADGDALRRKASAQLTPVQLDITNEEQIRQAAELVAQAAGIEGLAGLVNNAGISVPAPLEFLPLEEFRYQLEVNVTGQLAVTQAFLPLIREARGRIINVSSIGGRQVSIPFNGPYHASKFALEALSETLRMELSPFGVQVITIEPSLIATPMWSTALAKNDEIMQRLPSQAQQWYGSALQQARAGVANIGRHGAAPEKVAKVIAEALTTQRPRSRYSVS
ncbi:MAG TPA: SDR family oxidoreductase [Ktedonobacteraceae bacterium]|nr:SDR family oxidoreductase [Ktedonobacteraceae bacterium]